MAPVWQLDVGTRCLSLGEKSVKLSKPEALIAGMLMSAHERMVERDTLWRTMTENGAPKMVGTVVCTLRHKIRDIAVDKTTPIVTSYGSGYGWIGPAEVSVAAVIVPACAVKDLHALLQTHPNRDKVAEFSHVVFGV